MYLESVNIQLLEVLFKKNSRHLNELINASKLNRRQVLKAIDELNFFFHDNDFPNTITLHDDHVVFENRSLDLKEIKNNLSLILQPDERHAFLYCFIYGNRSTIKNIETLAEMLSVSRNTIINDLKFLRKRSDDFDLVYKQKDGYVIEGSEFHARLYFLDCYRLLYNRSTTLIKTLYASLFLSNKSFFDINNMFQRIEYDIFSGRNNFCAQQLKGLILLKTIHYDHNEFMIKHLNLCSIDSKIVETVRKFQTIQFNEQNFIIIILATMNLQHCENPYYTKSNLLISQAIVTNFIRLTPCDFNNIKQTERIVAALINKSIIANFYSIQRKPVIPSVSDSILESLKIIIYLLLDNYLLMLSNSTKEKLAEEISLIFLNNLSLIQESNAFDVGIFIPSSYEYSLSISLYLKHKLSNINVNTLSKRQLASKKFDLLITTTNSGQLVSKLNDKALFLSLPFEANYLQYIHNYIINCLIDQKNNLKHQASHFEVITIQKETTIEKVINLFSKSSSNNCSINFDYRELKINNQHVRIYYFTINDLTKNQVNTHYFTNKLVDSSLQHICFVNEINPNSTLMSISSIINNLYDGNF